MATSSFKPPLSPLNPLHHFTPIEEGNEDEVLSQGKSSFRASSPNENVIDKRLHLTPTYQNSPLGKTKRPSSKKRQENGEKLAGDDDDNSRGILCNKCRPSGKDKISVVPMDNSSLTSPNGILKSLFSSLVKKSPKSSDHDPEPPSSTASTEEQWKTTAAELTDKLVQTTRNKDEAVLEASRLKYAMSELEKKLNNLEIYCQSLKSGFELCNNNKPRIQYMDYNFAKARHQTKAIEYFTVAVSEARSSTRVLSRALVIHLKKKTGIVHEDRLALLLQPYDIKISSLSRNPRELLVFIEAFLNKAFYEDFEATGFQKSGPTRILNPIDRCEANFASFKGLQELTWGEVLTKGTRQFSEDYSKFCDRKMSEIVGMLCWNRAWPEQLLQSFFIASKAIWSVHLLAHSLHPSLPIFRVDKGAGFDSVYMEDMGGDKTRKLILVPNNVIIMVTPGFFVYDKVVKCKVICRYHNNNNNNNNNNGSNGHGHLHLSTPSPTYLASLSSN